MLKEAGGKMLLMHGWSDPEVPVGMTLDWYARVRRTMGGQESTDGFLSCLGCGMFGVL